MNKYELAVVVNAKLEDEDRAAVMEKVKALITRFTAVRDRGGRVGQEETCLRNPENERRILLLRSF